MRLADLTDRRAALLLVGTVVLLFAPTLGFGFVFDDTTVILQNPRLRSLSGLGQLWREDIWAFAGGNAGNYYRPLLGTWFWGLWQAFGEAAAGWHAIGVLAHAGVAALAFSFARRLGLGTVGALAGTALFALHPLAIQGGAWIVGVVDPLIAGLLLGACLLWLRGGRAVLGALGLLLAAMLIIERAFAFVGVLGLLLLLRPEGSRRAALLLLPLGLALAARHLAGVPLSGGGGELGHLDALRSAPTLLTSYLSHALWPAQLSLVYPVNLRETLHPVDLLLPTLALAAGLGMAWGHRRRLFFLGSACGLMVLPLDAALLPLGDLVADRYAYGPLLFVGLLLGDVLDGLAQKHPRRALLVAGLMLAPLLAMHPGNLMIWKDNLALYTRAHAVVPGHPKFTMNLSNERRRQGIGDAGCALAKQAHATVVAGRIPGDRVLAAYNLGNCLRASGEGAAAAAAYQEAAEASGGGLPEARHNLVVTLLELDRLDAAWEAAGLLIQEAPGRPESWRLRGLTNARLGRGEQAINCYRKLLELAPEDADAARAIAAWEASRSPGEAAAPPTDPALHRSRLVPP